MVIVVIHKNDFAFGWTIIALCYFGPCCRGEPHADYYECCGKDGTNPSGYVSGKDVGTVPCFEVVCP